MRCREFILCLMLLCPISVSAQRWQETDTLQELTKYQADSLFFRFSHHYTINFNFRLKADSLTLVPHESDFTDTCIVEKDEILVVADIRQTDSDTVWIKLYRDQMTMGWISEEQLLNSAIPDDLISEIIDFFNDNTTLLYLLIAVLLTIGVLMFKVNKLYSITYILLTATLVMASWHVINYSHDFWMEYYFHPTLNPFILPDEIKLIVILFWLICITTIALAFVLYDHSARR